MSIAKLTEDDLKQPDREVTFLTKLNQLVAAANNLTGDGTAGPVTATNLTVTGDTTIGNATSDKVGFYGTAAIAKQTGVAVSAAGIHAALVALGLIGA